MFSKMRYLVLLIVIFEGVKGATCHQQMAVIGEDVFIQCTYTDLPEYITWKFLDSFIITHQVSLVTLNLTENGGKYISEVKEEHSTFNLKIKNVSFSDSGSYQSAQYFAMKTTKVNHFILQVQGHPQLHQEINFSDEYQSVSASCCVKIGYFSGPVPFLWFVNDDLLKDGVGYGRETDVENVREMCNNITYQSQRWYNGKTLTCLVSNENNLNVSTTLHVLYGPSVVILNTSWPAFLNEGDNVSIHCDADGNPSPDVSLQRKIHGQDWETLPIKPISPYITDTVTRWRFEISDIDSSIVGNYRCIASNGFGLVKTKSEVLLNVYEQAEIRILNTSKAVREDDFINILCRTRGNPIPVVSLQKKSSDRVWETLPIIPEQLYNATGHSTISRFNFGYLSKRIVEVFRCIAVNGVGLNASSSEICINVVYPPSVKILNTSALINTNFVQDDIYILCEADGNPSPNVSLEWKRFLRHWNKLPLLPMVYSVGISSTTWRFDININETGYYRCNACNGVGAIGRSREILLEIPYYESSEIPTTVITTEDQQSRGAYLLCEINEISGEEIVTLQELSGDGHWISLPIMPTITTSLYGTKSWLFRTENISVGAEKTYRCFVMNASTAAGKGSEDLSIITDHHEKFSPVLLSIGVFLVAAVLIIALIAGKYCQSVLNTRNNREKEILDTDYMQREDDIYDFEVWRSHDPFDGTEV